MIRSTAHPRPPLSSSTDGDRPANFHASRTLRAVRRAICVAVVMLAAIALCAPAIAQTTSVRAEFRTTPRQLITQAVDRSRLATTVGAVSGEVATAQDLGARDPTAAMEHMQMVLRRPSERQSAFDAEVIALHQRGSPEYHRWLTPETIGVEFGPSAGDIATLTQYLESEGFTVNGVGKSGMFIDFSGTV